MNSSGIHDCRAERSSRVVGIARGVATLKAWRWVAISTCLLVVTVTPVATAAQVDGQFWVEGSLGFPGGARLGLHPLAVLVNDSSDMISFTVSGSLLHVCEGWREDVEATVAGSRLFKDLRGDVACYDLSAAEGRLVPGGNHAGWLGMYGRSSASATFEMLERENVHPQAVWSVSSPDANGVTTTTAPESPQRAYFTARGSEPSTYIAAIGQLVYQGPGALLLKGPDIQMRASENITDIATYDRPSGESAVRQRELRWLWVEATQLRLTIETAATPIHIVSVGDQTATWDGSAFMANATGTLREMTQSYVAEQQPATFDGRFTSSLVVNPQGDGFAVSLKGELRGTSLASIAPQGGMPPVRFFGDWLGVFIVGAMFGGTMAAGAVWWARRWRARQLFRRHRRVAEKFESEFDYIGALRQVLSARRFAPLDFDLALWEAKLRRDLGEWDDALDAYDTAATLAPAGDGSAQYWAAVTLLQRGGQGDDEAAFGYVMEALSREPTLAGEIENDPLFAPLVPYGLTGMLASAKEKADGPT